MKLSTSITFLLSFVRERIFTMPPKSGLVKFAPEKSKEFATTDKTFPQKMPRHNK